MSTTDTSAQSFANRAVLLPVLFVPLWSSGFVLARLVMPYADPLAFLAIRFVVAGLILAGVAVASGASWPRNAREWRNALIAGVLIHGIYLGGVFWSVANGLPTAISALVAGMQPLLVGILAKPLLDEPVSGLRKIGILIGASGALLTLAPKLGAVGEGAVPLIPLAACAVGMISITAGTIWQKQQAQSTNLLSGTAVQYSGALIPTLLGIVMVGHAHCDFTAIPLWVGLIWSVFAMSIGAVLLLFILIKRGAIAQVSALFYLVPGVSALMAWIGFGERLTPVQIGGMLVAAIGVAVANKG